MKGSRLAIALVTIVALAGTACSSATTVTVTQSDAAGGASESSSGLPPAEGTTDSPSQSPDAAYASTPGDSPDNPVPAGQRATAKDWEVSVVGVTLNADDAVKKEYGDKARPGYQYVMITVRMKNLGDNPKDPYYGAEFAAVAPKSGTLFESSDELLPKDLYEVGKVPPGVAGEGNVAFQVKIPEANSALTLYVSVGNEGSYLALK